MAEVVDDPAALAERDPGEMLRAVATAGAQVREAALRISSEDGAAVVRTVVADGRPRAVVVTGMGGSGIAGDVLAAVTGPACPIPVVVSRGYRLPGWVGPMDLVLGVSCSGETEETLSSVDEALRRGSRVVTVGRPRSALAGRAVSGRAAHLAVDAGGRMPRSNLWGLVTPLLALADGLGIASVPAGLLASVADQLDETSEACGPGQESVDNPAKRLALGLSGSLPMVWGTSELAGVAALRFACQLAENAKQPAVFGTLSEVQHNQVVTFAGRYGTDARVAVDDIFYDPDVDAGPPRERLRLVLLRDTEELEPIAARAKVSIEVAEQYGVIVDEVRAEGTHPLERVASLISLVDFASVYLGLIEDTDPTPIEPIVTVKRAMPARRTPADE